MTSRRISALLVAVSLGLAACSSSSDEKADATVTSATTDTATPTPTADTTAADTTASDTTAANTGPSESTTRVDPSLRVSPGQRGSSDLGDWDAEERDIIHTGHIYWDLIIRSLNADEADAADPDYVLHVNGPTRMTLQNLAAQTLDLGESTEGPAILQPMSVTVDGNTAILIECVLDAVDTLNADGTIREPADLEPTIWESIIVWQNPFWQTNEFRRIEGTCELDDRFAETVPFNDE